MRPVEILPGYLMTAEGSALIKAGNTHVLCAASVEDTVPPFLRNMGKGWVTAVYSMLPRCDGETHAARSDQRPAIGTDPRDPAADRAIAARRGGYRRARRAHHRRGL